MVTPYHMFFKGMARIFVDSGAPVETRAFFSIWFFHNFWLFLSAYCVFFLVGLPYCEQSPLVGIATETQQGRGHVLFVAIWVRGCDWLCRQHFISGLGHAEGTRIDMIPG